MHRSQRSNISVVPPREEREKRQNLHNLGSESPDEDDMEEADEVPHIDRFFSVRMGVVFVYVMQGWITVAILLKEINPRRASMWQLTEYRSFDSSIIDWLAFAHFQKFVLLSVIAFCSVGQPVMELRALVIVASLCFAELTTAPYVLGHLSQWTGISIGILWLLIGASSVYASGSTAPSAFLFATPNENSSRRCLISSPALALGIQTVLLSLRVGQMLFPPEVANDKESSSCLFRYSIHSISYSHPTAQSIGQHAIQLHMFSACLLGVSTVWAPASMQRRLLLAQCTSWVGWMFLHRENVPELTGSTAALVIALLGAIV